MTNVERAAMLAQQIRKLNKVRKELGLEGNVVINGEPDDTTTLFEIKVTPLKYGIRLGLGVGEAERFMRRETDLIRRDIAEQKAAYAQRTGK
jgi:hypothetical protein